MKSYKGYTRAQLIDILADYAVFTATVNNNCGGARQNTNKGDYVGLYPGTAPTFSGRSARSFSS